MDSPMVSCCDLDQSWSSKVQLSISHGVEVAVPPGPIDKRNWPARDLLRSGVETLADSSTGASRLHRRAVGGGCAARGMPCSHDGIVSVVADNPMSIVTGSRDGQRFLISICVMPVRNKVVFVVSKGQGSPRCLSHVHVQLIDPRTPSLHVTQTQNAR